MTSLKYIVAGLGLASSVGAACQDLTPSVTVKNGTYSGLYSAYYHQDFFLGMPYAQVPERFTVAQGLNSTWDGTHQATVYPKHCVGYGGDEIGYPLSENCLYLNVIRPSGINETADLPVAVWIHGGGLVMGGSADKRYNLSFIVEHSVDMGTPIIGVSLNYRLSAFGFLTGEAALAAGATNIGFRDQRLALQWVHENIGAFGGSSEKVTIWGESSGAESMMAQVLAYNGRDDGLFRAAVAESGFGGFINRYPGGFNATDAMQQTYDNLVGNTSACAHLIGSAKSLDCLRTAPFADINHALNVSFVGPWPPVLDHDFFQDYTANQLSKGDFLKVPVLAGTNTDEGTAFGGGQGPNGTGVNTDEEFRNATGIAIGAANTTKSVSDLLDEVAYLYPNVQAVGIPSLTTWPQLVEPGSVWAKELGLQTRRTDAYFGDFSMHYTRRRASIVWSENGLALYSYRFDTNDNGTPAEAGATHFQEVCFVFQNFNGVGYVPPNPMGGNGTFPMKRKALAKQMGTAWVNFFTSLDPNKGAGLDIPGLAAWPAYNTSVGGGVGQNIVWGLDSTTVEMDDWRVPGIQWMMDHALDVYGN